MRKSFLPHIGDRERKNKDFGFTLLEMVIVTGVLGILLISATGLFTIGLRAQKALGATHELLQNVWYAHDQMTQKIIFSTCKPFDSTGCGSPVADGTYSEIRVKNTDGKTIRYFRGACGASSNAVCEENVDDAITTPLTSRKIAVDILSFIINGNENKTRDNQPRVTVIIKARAADAPSQTINLQHTVSMRAITFE